MPNLWVEQFAKELSPGRAIDLAGGEGRNALWLAQLGWEALVVDFSQVALDRALELATQRLGSDAPLLTIEHGDLRRYLHVTPKN